MAKAVQIKRLDLAHYKFLPSLVSNSNYNGRNRYSGGRSVEILGPSRLGSQSLTSSTSEELNKFSQDVAISWNILDFGLSYVRAKQAADEVLIAEELKRKVVNRVIEDVRTAYWRAVSGQRLLGKLRGLERRVARALVDNRQLYESQEIEPVTALTYERELLEVQREIENLQSDLKLAKSQLAALMNLKPGTKYTLSGLTGAPSHLHVKTPYSDLVHIALNNRPEMLEVVYRDRINQKEADAALLEMLPGIQAFAGYNYDSNDFLFNNHWVSWGAKASWNLIKVFQYPERKALVKAEGQLLDQRALALAMAIMTQVHVSRVRFFHRRKELRTAERFLRVQRQLVGQLRNQASENRLSEQILIREEMNTLLAEVKHDIAFSNLQNAYANVYASVGVDPFGVAFNDATPIDSLAASLRRLWFERGDHSRRLRVAAK